MLVVGVAVSPADVAADHAALFLVGGVVGAVEGEVAQGGELGFEAVEPGAVGRGVGDLDVVRDGPAADALALVRAQVRARSCHRRSRSVPAAEKGCAGSGRTPGTACVSWPAGGGRGAGRGPGPGRRAGGARRRSGGR